LKLNILTITLFTAVQVTGCGTPPVIYRSPSLPEQKLSKVTLANLTNIPVGIIVYKDSPNCIGPEALSTRSGVMPQSTQVITVERGKPFTVNSIWTPRGHISVSGNNNQCTLPFTFLAEKSDHTFVLNFDGKSCSVTEATAIAKTPLVKREYQIPFTSAQAWCKPMSPADAQTLEKK
jgi:hypothetical protein